MTTPEPNAALEHFAGNTAHDLNNLLTAILGNLEMARLHIARGNTEPVGGYLDAATAAAGRTALLAQRLTVFSGRSAPAPAPTDLAPLLHALAEAAPRPVTLHLPAALPLALCAETEAEQALSELLDNAFTAGGEVSIAAAATDGALTLTVQDTGPGMAPETLAHATEPFFSTWGKGAGKGLGLAIASAIAQRAGGTLRLESREGRGTTAALTLPLA
jgi:signal transduction histidine kinase